VLFWCRIDNLFGNCQSRSHVDGGWADDYQYRLSGAQLSELYHVVLRLVADGYTWHHRHTQCVLYATLSRYRRGSMVSSIPMICGDIDLLDGESLANASQPGVQRVSPSTRSHPSRSYDRAFGKFKKFMQGIQANDLLALKRFLLDESSYKQPASVKTVPEPTKPSVVPSAQDLRGTLF